VVEWLTLCFVFGRSRIQISARRPAILAEDFRGSPQSLQANAGMVPKNSATTASFHIPSNLSFTYHTSIQHYTAEVPKLWSAPPWGGLLVLAGRERVVCMRDIYCERNMGLRWNTYFGRHFAWLKYFTYHLVLVTTQNYKQHILSLTKLGFLSVSQHVDYWKWSDTVVAADIIFVLLCRRKKLLHFGLHIHLQGQYPIQFPFLHCETLALFYTVTYISLKSTLTLNSMLLIGWTLCQMCLFEFIQVEGDAKFLKHLKGGGRKQKEFGNICYILCYWKSVVK
jgi:hypothetical protein